MATSKNTKNMTPAQRNANTVKNIKDSLAGPKKYTGISSAVKSAAKAPAGKTPVKTPVKTPAKPKTESKKAIPASDSRYKNMTPAERNANTLKNVKESVAGPKKATGIKTAVANAAKKGPTKKATNLPEVKVTPPKKTTPASNNTSIEQKAKDVMSGKYGSGAARKTALGADYDKVQAIINKKATTTKAKPTGPSKGTVATMQKNIKDEQEGRLKFDEPVASVSTKSTEVKPEVKPAAVDVDKSIDAAMKGIAKSKIMRKGGNVKMKKGGIIKSKKK